MKKQHSKISKKYAVGELSNKLLMLNMTYVEKWVFSLSNIQWNVSIILEILTQDLGYSICQEYWKGRWKSCLESFVILELWSIFFYVTIESICIWVSGMYWSIYAFLERLTKLCLLATSEFLMVFVFCLVSLYKEMLWAVN